MPGWELVEKKNEFKEKFTIEDLVLGICIETRDGLWQPGFGWLNKSKD